MSGAESGRPRVLVLDNHDSFTWNLVQLLEGLGAECLVHRSDALDPEAAWALEPDGVVLSPGPFGPGRTGVCAAVVRGADVPVLGVCLGMQVIAAVGGARVLPSGAPVHGKARQVWHDGRGLFRGLPSPLRGALYHSLVVDPATVGEQLEVTARSAEGVIMGCRLTGGLVEGVLFHPESFLTEHGEQLVANFVDRVEGRRGEVRRVC